MTISSVGRRFPPPFGEKGQILRAKMFCKKYRPRNLGPTPASHPTSPLTSGGKGCPKGMVEDWGELMQKAVGCPVEGSSWLTWGGAQHSHFHHSYSTGVQGGTLPWRTALGLELITPSGPPGRPPRWALRASPHFSDGTRLPVKE